MHDPGLKSARALIVVARILVKERGEDRMSQQVTAPSVHKFCGITLGVSRRALAISCKRIVGLFDAGCKADADNCNRIECAPYRKRELLFPGEWGCVINVACIKVRHDAH